VYCLPHALCPLLSALPCSPSMLCLSFT
jgi:hypothetical protein